MIFVGVDIVVSFCCSCCCWGLIYHSDRERETAEKATDKRSEKTAKINYQKRKKCIGKWTNKTVQNKSGKSSRGREQEEVDPY